MFILQVVSLLLLFGKSQNNVCVILFNFLNIYYSVFHEAKLSTINVMCIFFCFPLTFEPFLFSAGGVVINFFRFRLNFRFNFVSRFHILIGLTVLIRF